MSCCPDYKRNEMALRRTFRLIGGKPMAFCPWCGKGVTALAPQVSKYDPLTSIGAGPMRRRAELQTKSWPKGDPACPRCKGQGWILRRIGCCEIKPVSCPSCFKIEQVTKGGQA